MPAGEVVLLVGGLGTLLGGIAALIKARSEVRRNSADTARSDRDLEREIARIVNDRLEIVFRGYDKIGEEREADIRRLLERIEELIRERDGLAGRVRDLAQELDEEKRRRRAGDAKLSSLEADLAELRKVRSHRRGTDA